MSLVGDIIDRVLFPNRELHVDPGARRRVFAQPAPRPCAGNSASEIERPDDLALGPDGALYVSSGDRDHSVCAGDDFAERTVFASFASPVGGLAWTADGRPARLRVEAGTRCAFFAAASRRRKARKRGGEPIACPTSVTVAIDGTIYATDGSRTNPPELWLDRSDAEPCRLRSTDFLRSGFERCEGVVRTDWRWPSGVVVSHDGKEVWVGESWAHRLTAVLPRRQSASALSSRTTQATPAVSSRGAAGDYWMAFFGLAHPAHRIRAARARILRGDDEDGSAGTVDRPDAGRSLQLSRADADRPHQETRHPEALGAGALLWPCRAPQWRRERRPRVCTAGSTGEFTASPPCASIGSQRDRRLQGTQLSGRACRRPRASANQRSDHMEPQNDAQTRRCFRSSRAARSTADCMPSTGVDFESARGRNSCPARRERRGQIDACARRSPARSR